MVSFPVILLRLMVALLIGAFIGLEREIHERSAGMRTLALVSLGSALFTVISAYGFIDIARSLHVSYDPTRIASYIVAGIGFLGGGTIFLSREKEKVQGLTTAAAIWVVAAVGMACGAGFIVEAVVTTALAFFVLYMLYYVERAIVPHPASSIHHLHLEATAVTPQFIASVYDTCARNEVTVEKLQLLSGQEVESIELLCRASDAPALTRVISELHALPGIHALHADLHEPVAPRVKPKDTTR